MLSVRDLGGYFSFSRAIRSSNYKIHRRGLAARNTYILKGVSVHSGRGQRVRDAPIKRLCPHVECELRKGDHHRVNTHAGTELLTVLQMVTPLLQEREKSQKSITGQSS